MSERRLHQCHQTECDAEAQWGINIVFLCVGVGIYRHRLSCDSSIKVCGRHCKAAMEYLLSTQNRKRINAWLKVQNFPSADFETAEVEFVRIDHEAISADFAAAQEAVRQLELERQHKDELAKIAKGALDYARKVVEDKDADPDERSAAQTVLAEMDDKQ